MTAMERAIKYFGSQGRMASVLGITQPTISEWLRHERPVPLTRCLEIEHATNGAVRCEALRPDIPWSVLRARIAPAEAK